MSVENYFMVFKMIFSFPFPCVLIRQWLEKRPRGKKEIPLKQQGPAWGEGEGGVITSLRCKVVTPTRGLYALIVALSTGWEGGS